MRWCSKRGNLHQRLPYRALLSSAFVTTTHPYACQLGQKLIVYDGHYPRHDQRSARRDPWPVPYEGFGTPGMPKTARLMRLTAGFLGH